MDTDANSYLLSGAGVDFPDELPSMINDKLSVVSVDGEVTVYDGANDEDMVGFYRSTTNAGRLPYLNLSNVNPYLSPVGRVQIDERSEEHTSELQSLMRISYAVFCLKKKNKQQTKIYKKY